MFGTVSCLGAGEPVYAIPMAEADTGAPGAGGQPLHAAANDLGQATDA